MIETWVDTGPAWLGGIGGILAALVSAYALYRATRAEQRHVEWQKTQTERSGGKKPNQFALVNGTSGVTARVLAVEDVSDGLRDAVRNDLKLPEDVVPGGSIPLRIDRSMASAYPTIVQITWQEGKIYKRIRRRRYTSTFYFD